MSTERQLRVKAKNLSPSTRKPEERLLRVTTEYFVAGAVFQKLYGVWSCVLAAPILKWMVGKTPDTIKVALLRMGAGWEWLEGK